MANGRTLIVAMSMVAAGAVLIQFYGPEATNPGSDPGRALAAHVAVPADTAAILQRACRDCHSNETRWPWYSHVAPVSWFVIDHVNHGRSHFNYSDWARYDPEEADRLLKKSCELVRKGSMPMASYRRMHAQAALTVADVEALCRWSASAAAANETAQRQP